MPGPYQAHGTEVRIGATGDGNSTSWTKIGLVRDPTGPEESVGFTNVTNHDSSAIERLPDLNDPGTFSFQLLYNSTEPLHGSATGSSVVAAGIVNDLQNQTNRDVRVVMPSTLSGETVIDFAGWFSNMGQEFPHESGAITRDMEFQISGSISYSTST